MPKTVTKNIEYLHGKRSREVVRSLNDQQLEALEAKLGDDLQTLSGQPAANLTKLCDEKFSFGRGVSLSALRYFLANKIWTADMSTLIEPNLPLVLQARRPLFTGSEE